MSRPGRAGGWSPAARHERVADILDAAAEIAVVIELGRDARAQHPGIPWRDIIGLRVVLAHHYHRVDPGQVWVIAATEVPRLVQDLHPAR